MGNTTNLNRDYLIKINVKEGTIDVPKMTFWNTDKKTSNMFVQLVINMSTNELISQYVTVQNATDYKITLNVIKPKTKQYKTIEATLLNEDNALFEIDLPDEFTDQVGNYTFEFEVSSKVENNDESITTSSSSYTVNGSILTNLNQETSSSPDLPILKQLIEQVKSLQGGDLTDYQKKSDAVQKTTIEDGKLYLTKSDGTKLDDGTALPTGSGTSIDDSDTATDKTWSSSKIDTQFKDIAHKIENVGQPTQEQINTSVNSYLEKNPISFNQVWKGKKATFYGDSLTEVNFQYTKGYHKWIQEILGLTSYENFGVSGYKISDVYNKVNSTTATGDIIFVMCGVNDENFSTPLGTIGDTATDTIYGSYDNLCSLLKTKYPTKIILFITPHYQTAYPHKNGITSYEVSKAMKEVCEKYAINVYDNYAISGIYPQNNTNKNIFTKDGCHWNDLGHEIVGKNLANYVLNTYRYVYTESTENPTSIPCTNITLNNTTLSFTSTDTQILTATLTPTNTTDAITWSVSPSGICTVENGVVTPISNGECVITAKCGEKTATCNITVSGIAKYYTITNNLTNCINSNSDGTIEENNSYSAILTANNGYTLENITITMGGTDVTSTVYNDGIINVNSVIGDIIITATAIEQIIDYVGKTVTVTKQFNGSMIHLTALIKSSEDIQKNSVVSFEFEGTDVTNMTDGSTEGGQIFSDTSGKLNNGKYTKILSSVYVFSQTVSNNNLTITNVDRTINSSIDDAKYIKVPIILTGTVPYSFKITKLKIYVDDIERQILKLGAFFNEDNECIEIS